MADPVTRAISLPDGSPPAVTDAVGRLRAAQDKRIPCSPVRDLLPGTVQAGYAVQQQLTAIALAEGRRAIGRKIGLTNPMVQAQLGVEQPDFGVLFADMAVPDGGTVDIGRLLQPRIEAEVAMTLGADLDGPSLGADHVRAAVSEVVVALEIVDSRIAGWDITIVDTIADNASSGLYVLGGHPVPLADLDLRAVGMSLYENNTEVSTGHGVDCLGDPLAALAWLAVTARDLGTPLHAGDIVLSGALGPMVPVHAGATYAADVTGLGSARVSFIEGIHQ